MRNYHVQLVDGTERNVHAADVTIADGAIVFSNAGAVVCAYAPGSWLLVEVERLDDKG